MPVQKTEDRKAQFHAAQDHKVVRLERELERFEKLIALQLEALTNEAADALQPTSPRIAGAEVLKKLKDLGATLNSATDAKIRLAKAQKLLSESMTPEQEAQALRTVLRSMPRNDRADWLRKEIAYHNADPELVGPPMQVTPA